MGNLATTKYFGKGLYALPHAARMVGVKNATLRHWFFGYARKEKSYEAVVHSPYAPEEGNYVISFENLLVARFIHEFRESGLSLQKIREAALIASDLFHPQEDSHPFLVHSFRTDGNDIFAEMAKCDNTASGAVSSDDDDESESAMIQLLKRQLVFKKVIEPSLKGLEYGHDGRVESWRPTESAVCLRPDIQFGAPTVEGVATDVIFEMVTRAGSTIVAVANWFGIERQSVLDAMEYENNLARA